MLRSQPDHHIQFVSSSMGVAEGAEGGVPGSSRTPGMFFRAEMGTEWSSMDSTDGKGCQETVLHTYI